MTIATKIKRALLAAVPQKKLFIVVVCDRDNPQLTAKLATTLHSAPKVGAKLNVFKVFNDNNIRKASIDVNGQEWTFCGSIVDGSLSARQLLTVIDTYEVDLNA